MPSHVSDSYSPLLENIRLLGDPLSCHETIMRQANPGIYLREVAPPLERRRVGGSSDDGLIVEPLPLYHITPVPETSRFLRRQRILLESCECMTTFTHELGATLTLRRDNGFRAVYTGTGRGYDGEVFCYTLKLRTDVVPDMRRRGIVAAGTIVITTHSSGVFGSLGPAMTTTSDDVDIYSHATSWKTVTTATSHNVHDCE